MQRREVGETKYVFSLGINKYFDSAFSITTLLRSPSVLYFKYFSVVSYYKFFVMKFSNKIISRAKFLILNYIDCK